MSSVEKDKNKIIFTIIYIVLIVIMIISICFIIKNKTSDEIIDDLNGIDSGDVASGDIDDEEGIYEELGVYTVNEPGDFKIQGEQLLVLDEIVKAYDDAIIGTQFSEFMELYGEPSSVKEYAYYTIYRFELPESYIKISVNNATGEMEEKILFIMSSSELNIQYSKELDTDIDNLVERMENITEEMTVDEVVEILGDKYLEKEATSRGIRTYVWFDKCENKVEITFDNDNNIYRLGHVMGEW